MKKIWLFPCFLIFGFMFYYFYPEQKLSLGQKADKIIVNKSKHELLLSNNEEIIATYKISLGRKGLGKKTIKGDNLTPEGRFIGKKRSQSKFHKAIEIGEWGRCCDVLIHGQKFTWTRKLHRWQDWTQGCIALTNDEIDEIYRAVNDGIIIEINP